MNSLTQRRSISVTEPSRPADRFALMPQAASTTAPARRTARWHFSTVLAALTQTGQRVTCGGPHGYQRALGIAMALAARPRLLLLDEPVTGMNLIPAVDSRRGDNLRPGLQP